MKQGRIKMTWLLVLALILCAALALSACTPEDNTSGNTTDSPSGTPNSTGNQQTQNPSMELSFAAGDTVTAELEGTTDVSIHTESDYVRIEGDGSFRVKTADGKELTSDENGQIQIENTSDNYMSMVLEVTVDTKTTLRFTLIHNPGTEGNPYLIPAGGSKELTYTKDVNFKVETGWYKIVGEDNFVLTNYELDEDGIVYLIAGMYGISKTTAGESVVRISATEAPAGYTAENPVDIDTVGKNERKTYKDVTLYFRFTAPEDGLYIFALGDEGRSANSRFAVSADDYKTYYGRYNENDEWKYCAAGTTYTAVLRKGEQLTVAIDYTMGEYMVGEENVCLCVSEPATVEKLDSTVKTNLPKRGQACFSFTATEKGVYSVNLRGLDDSMKTCKFTLTTEDEGEASTEYGYGDSAIVRLDAGETVYIIVRGEKNEFGNVGIAVSEATEEPLPEGEWLSGFYTYSYTMEFVLYHDEGRIVLGSNEADFTYLDGVISFTVQSVDYKLLVNEENEYIVRYVNSNEETIERKLTYTTFPTESIAVEAFAGIYRNEDALLIIYADGSGFYDGTLYNEEYALYFAEKNTIRWSNNCELSVSGALVDGKAAAIALTPNGGTAVTFTRVEDVTDYPEQSLLDVLGESEYRGENGNKFVKDKLNGRAPTILHATNGRYLVYATCADGEKALLRLVIDTNAETIEIYDVHDKLLDTLTVYDESQEQGEPATFPEESQGKYIGSNYELTIFDSTVDYVDPYGTSVQGAPVNLRKDGRYVFTVLWNDQPLKIYFTFGEDGKITLIDGESSFVLAVEAGEGGGEQGGGEDGGEGGGEQGGEDGGESGTVETGAPVAGTFKDSTGHIEMYRDSSGSVNYFIDSYSMAMKISPDEKDGIYTFTYRAASGTVTVKFYFTKDGNVQLEDAVEGSFLLICEEEEKEDPVFDTGNLPGKYFFHLMDQKYELIITEENTLTFTGGGLLIRNVKFVKASGWSYPVQYTFTYEGNEFRFWMKDNDTLRFSAFGNDDYDLAIDMIRYSEEVVNARNENGIPWLNTEKTNTNVGGVWDTGYDSAMFYVCVKESGWYTFTTDGNGCRLFKVSRLYAVPEDWSTATKVDAKGATLYLEAGQLLAFYGESFSASYSATDPTESKVVLGTESAPIVWDGNGKLQLDDYRKGTDELLYIQLTATASGTYKFDFAEEETTGSAEDEEESSDKAEDYQTYLLYNGVIYGRIHEENGEVGGTWTTKEPLPFTITLSEGETITFAIAYGMANEMIDGWYLICEIV